MHFFVDVRAESDRVSLASETPLVESEVKNMSLFTMTRSERLANGRNYTVRIPRKSWDAALKWAMNRAAKNGTREEWCVCGTYSNRVRVCFVDGFTFNEVID